MQKVIKTSQDKSYALMLAPALIVLIILGIIPIASIFGTSLLKWELIAFNNPEFYGLGNFIDMFRDRRFLHSIGIQMIMSLGSVAVQLLAGLIVALIFKNLKGWTRIFRSIIVVPFVMPPVVVALMWLTIFTPSIGPINKFLETIGIAGPQWLSVGWLAVVAIIIADSWNSFPFSAILILSALQNVPEDLYEAARIDGANKWAQTRFITLPFISWSIVMSGVLRIIESFKAFPLIFILTGGGPGSSTEVTNFYAYLSAFQYGHLGYGSALSFTMFLLTVVMSVFIIRSNRKALYR